MPLSARIESLKKRHAEIEHQLHIEEARAAQDEIKINKLKREKLNLKDEITKLEQSSGKAAWQSDRSLQNQKAGSNDPAFFIGITCST